MTNNPINTAQLLNDQEEAMRQVLDGRQVGIWTAIPGIITSINLTEMTCEVQPAIQSIIVNQDGVAKPVDISVLPDVPLVFPSGGGFTVTFPMEVGDEVLVLFSSRCIDAWWQSGGVQQAMESRMHDLSDGFAIPGPKSIPNVIGSISSTKLQIRNNAGTVFLGVGTKFAMTNATTDLKSVLVSLQGLLNTFMGVLAALTPGSTPVTNVVLSVPAAAAVTSLGLVLTEINALLEAS